MIKFLWQLALHFDTIVPPVTEFSASVCRGKKNQPNNDGLSLLSKEIMHIKSEKIEFKKKVQQQDAKITILRQK